MALRLSKTKNNMKNGLQIFAFALLVVLAGCKGCREEDPKPCANAKPISADFRICHSRDTGGILGDELIEFDTLIGEFIYFQAKQEGAKEYKWWIGNEEEPRYGRTISLGFHQTPRNQSIRVKLVVSNPTDSCLSIESRFDSSIKEFYLMSADSFLKSNHGMYKMVSVHQPNDTFLAIAEHIFIGGQLGSVGYANVVRFKLPNCTVENYYEILDAPFYSNAKPLPNRELKPNCYPPENLIAGYDCFVIFSGPGRRELRIRYMLKSAPQGGPRTGLFFRGIKI
jgi:hypothetical protein